MNKRYIDFVPATKKTAPRTGGNKVAVSSGSRGVKVANAGSRLKKDESELKNTGLGPKMAGLGPKNIGLGPKMTNPAPKAKTGLKITRNEAAVFETEANTDVRVEEVFAERPRPAGVSTGRVEPKFGVIEDYHPKFVQTEVAKRPLGAKVEGKKPTKTNVGPLPTMARAGVAGNRAIARGKAVGATRATVGATRATVGATRATPKSAAAMRPIKANFVNTNKIEKRPLSKGGAALKRPVTVPKEEPKKKPEVIIAKPAKDSKAGMIVAVILTIILGAAAGTVAFLLLPK